MAKVEYQVMATVNGQALTAWDMRAFIPAGVEPEENDDGSGAALIALRERSAAIAMRENIRQAHPFAQIRVYEQQLDDEDAFLDENEGNCVLDKDGIYVGNVAQVRWNEMKKADRKQ